MTDFASDALARESARLRAEAHGALDAEEFVDARALALRALRLAWRHLAKQHKSAGLDGPLLADDAVLETQALLTRIGRADTEELPIPTPLADLFQACESFCVAACCGHDAFDLSGVASWLHTANAATRRLVAQQLDDLVATLGSGHFRSILSSDLFCEELAPTEWLEYLRQWQSLVHLEGG